MPTPIPDPLAAALNRLADRFDRARPAMATLAAIELRRAARTPPAAPPGDRTSRLEGDQDALMRRLLTEEDADPVATPIAAAWPLIRWPTEDAARAESSSTPRSGIVTTDLIGDDAPWSSAVCRIGLFAQLPGVHYPLRHHAAEELYFIIAGDAEWRQSDSPFETIGPGRFVHHASYEPHASRTGDRATLAVWVWAGDVSTDSYAFLDQPGTRAT